MGEGLGVRAMKKFYIKASVFLLINILVMLGLLSFSYYSDKDVKFKNWETESSLFVIPENTHYDVMIMGNSHGRQFSRGSNHKYFEEKMQKKMMNVARGLGGGGITNMLINLEYFYCKNNSVDTILYFIDPYVFYYEEWNEGSTFLNDEPLDPLYFGLCVKHHISKNGLLNYARTKFSDEWMGKVPLQYHFNSLTNADTVAIHKRLSTLYMRSAQEGEFQKYAIKLESIIQILQNKNAHVTFIIPPTLLGKQPQADRLLKLLEEMKTKYGIAYFNHFDKVLDPAMYTDHDHLNEAGVRFYIDFVTLQ